VPEGRVKPLGTGHAVLAVRDAVDVPFAVCNADDYYGPGAYRLLAAHLSAKASTPPPPVHAFVGYRLDETLSDHGGVARAVATTDPDGLVTRLVEVKDVRRDQREFTGAEFVSMNLWGFTPAVFPALQTQFEAFLAARILAPDSEFLLSTALNDQVAAGRARLRVLPAPDRWLGMTFAADVEAVRAALAALVRAGTYPPDLRAAFTRL
jgi:hypothetical protein